MAADGLVELVATRHARRTDGVIAAQLGHSDTRMTEKHYTHLAPSYIADTIRAHFPTLGLGVDDRGLRDLIRRMSKENPKWEHLGSMASC